MDSLTTKPIRRSEDASVGDGTMKRVLLIAVALALTTVPAQVMAQEGGSNSQADGTDRVTFYGHLFGHGLSAPQPSNTNQPIGEANYGLGTYEVCTPAAGWSLGGEFTPRQGPCEESPWNRIALFSTAGPVDVDTPSEFEQEGGYAMLHNERGQTKDIQLDSSGEIKATVFGSIDFHGWSVGNAYGTHCAYPHPSNTPCVYPYWGWDVGAQPEFVVEATLYQADLGSRSNSSAAPPVQEAIESGNAEIVAQGQWGPEIAMTGLPNTPNAQQFDINLGTPATDTIAKDNDFFIDYRVYSTTPAGEVSPTTFRWWSGEFFPSSYELPVKNAFSVERVIPNFANGKLAMLGIMNTPWGSYDVNSDSVDLEIEGPNGNSVSPNNIDRFSSFSVAHGGHFKPVNVTWIWDYRSDQISSGEYTVSVSATNSQGSASGECSAKFTIEEDDQGLLVPGNVQEGVCGSQTASQEFVEQVKEGSEEQTGGS